MAEDELCASLRRIADTIETNGGWHIAAIKVRAAAEEIERLTAEKALYHGRAAAYLIQRDRLREAVQWVVRDAAYKAPEQMGAAMAARWIDRLQSALAPEPRDG